jgi:hypothetical protein
MFAPPICRRRWRNTLFRSVSSDEDGGNPASIAASGASNRTQRDPQRPGLRAAGWTSEGADALFRLRASEEGSGYPAQSSASGASKQMQERAIQRCLAAVSEHGSEVGNASLLYRPETRQ